MFDTSEFASFPCFHWQVVKIMFDVGKPAHFEFVLLSAWLAVWIYATGSLFFMSSWDSYQQGSPILICLADGLNYLFSKFANPRYSWCFLPGCPYSCARCAKKLFCLRQDAPKFVLFSARIAKICIHLQSNRHNWTFIAILNLADCHLWIQLIATFEFGWLPPLNSADCHLSIWLIAISWSGPVPHYRRDRHNWIPIAFLKTADGQTFLKMADGQTFSLEILTPGRRTGEPV